MQRSTINELLFLDLHCPPSSVFKHGVSETVSLSIIRHKERKYSYRIWWHRHSFFIMDPSRADTSPPALFHTLWWKHIHLQHRVVCNNSRRRAMSNIILMLTVTSSENFRFHVGRIWIECLKVSSNYCYATNYITINKDTFVFLH
jgi:hypothetical protein